MQLPSRYGISYVTNTQYALSFLRFTNFEAFCLVLLQVDGSILVVEVKVAKYNSNLVEVVPIADLLLVLSL